MTLYRLVGPDNKNDARGLTLEDMHGVLDTADFLRAHDGVREGPSAPSGALRRRTACGGAEGAGTAPAHDSRVGAPLGGPWPAAGQ